LPSISSPRLHYGGASDYLLNVKVAPNYITCTPITGDSSLLRTLNYHHITEAIIITFVINVLDRKSQWVIAIINNPDMIKMITSGM
jgi:hypothetical protein